MAAKKRGGTRNRYFTGSHDSWTLISASFRATFTGLASLPVWILITSVISVLTTVAQGGWLDALTAMPGLFFAGLFAILGSFSTLGIAILVSAGWVLVYLLVLWIAWGTLLFIMTRRDLDGILPSMAGGATLGFCLIMFDIGGVETLYNTFLSALPNLFEVVQPLYVWLIGAGATGGYFASRRMNEVRHVYLGGKE